MSYDYQISKYLNETPFGLPDFDIYNTANKERTEILFIKCIGYYKYQFRQNFNPAYWIRTLLFLPQIILEYSGINFKKGTIHFLNLIYWISSVIFAIYNTEITTYIKDLVKLLFEYFTKK